MAVIAMHLTLTNAGAQTLKLLRTTPMPNYPSASAMEWHQNRLYVMGDDATGMLVVDKKHRVKTVVPIFDSVMRRIPPAEKTDIEATALVPFAGKKHLLLMPSLSSAKRNTQVLYTLEKGSLQLQKMVKVDSTAGAGLQPLNIEGATAVSGKLFLSNRGNLAAPQNHLVQVQFRPDTGVYNWGRPILLRMPQTQHFAGVSGLYYLEGKDILLFTASTELTNSATTDGEIGDSFLGMVKGFSNKINQPVVQVDTMINLTPILQNETPQKIESVTVESVRRNTIKLHLAADNDNGQSTLFRLRLKL